MARLNFKKSTIETDTGPIDSVVYTGATFAKRIIDYFRPQFQAGDTFVDPCAGRDAFYSYLPNPKTRCELQDGIDFTSIQGKWNWCISNPPWQSKSYRKVSRHAYEHCDNVIWLCRWDTLLGTGARHRDYLEFGHKLKEVIMVDWRDAGFYYQDGSPKQPEGFLLCVAHFSKKHTGETKMTYWWKQ